MTHSIGWNFPSNGGGQESGFNDSGIETFAGQPFESLAREIIQNSLDARASRDTAVTVCFELEKIHIDDFPGHNEILSVMKKCLKASQDDQKAKDFFQNAVKVLNSANVNCLKILDYNTTGLQDGKDKNMKSGQWHRLIKAMGKPQTQELAGGSYGIGKNAPFAVSALRTVFYSTRYRKNGEIKEYAQGKAILVSHELNNSEETTQAAGFYGVKENCDRLKKEQIPKVLKRDKTEDGTTLLMGITYINPQKKHLTFHSCLPQNPRIRQ